WRREGERQPVYLVVLVHVPERTVVCGVHIHRGIVAPTGVGGRLYTRAINDDTFAQSKLAQRIATEPSAIADTRIDIRSVNYAIAQSDVAFLIHGDAAHPTMHSVIGRIGTLLKDRVSGAGPPDLIPADARYSGKGLHRLVGYQGLMVFEVAISEAPERPLPTQEIEILGGVCDTRLRKAIAAAGSTG